MEEATDRLSILKSSSLTSVLEQQLERLIVSGELAPGDRLNEIQLSARFGTSRGPLREATRSLEAKGFVEMIRNRGVFVRQLGLAEACEIYEVRGTLFGLAGRLLAAKITDDLLTQLEVLVDRMETAADKNDFETYYPLNLEFHELILRESGNKTLIAEYHRFVNKMHLFRAKGLVKGGGLAVSNSEHREIFDALASRDPDRAYTAHWRHVDRAKQRMITAVEMSQT